jgi:hypothetical protein
VASRTREFLPTSVLALLGLLTLSLLLEQLALLLEQDLERDRIPGKEHRVDRPVVAHTMKPRSARSSLKPPIGAF